MCDDDGPRLWFKVEGPPVPTARHRVRVDGDGHVRTFNPRATKQAKLAVRQAAWIAMKQAGLSPWPAGTAVEVEIICAFPYPVGTAKKRRIDGQPMPQKPDVDNLAKTVMDGLNTVAWHDDGQVAAITIIKQRCEPASEAGVYVTVREAMP